MSQQPIDPTRTDDLSGNPEIAAEPGPVVRRPPTQTSEESSGDEAGDFARERGGQVARDAREQGGQVAAHAREEGRQVADTARDEGRRVAGTARYEVAQVGEEARTQTRNLVRQAQEQLHDQAEGQAHRIADLAHQLAGGLQALVEGRPEEAGPVGNYTRQATDQVERLASRLDQRGFDGVIDDVQRFARRRPGVFLLGAATAGFLAGRLVRSARDAGDGPAEGTSSRPYTGPGPYGDPEIGTTGTSRTAAGPEAQMPGTTVPPAPGPIEQEPLSRPMTGPGTPGEER